MKIKMGVVHVIAICQDCAWKSEEDMSECKSCGAPILWVETKNGKKMPLDATPFSAIQVKEGIGEVIQVYMPHWSSCPGADKFRRKP